MLTTHSYLTQHGILPVAGGLNDQDEAMVRDWSDVDRHIAYLEWRKEHPEVEQAEAPSTLDFPDVALMFEGVNRGG